MVDVLFSEADIAEQVSRLARLISQDYKALVSRQHPLIVLPVLKGAWIFSADLVRCLALPVRLEFLRASSYRDGTSSGELHVDIPDIASLGGHHLLVIEDIVDTGRTLSRMLEDLRACHPHSLKVCTLLDKPARRIMPVELHYRGFSVGNRFVVGYGMDLAECYRELPYVGDLGGS